MTSQDLDNAYVLYIGTPRDRQILNWIGDIIQINTTPDDIIDIITKHKSCILYSNDVYEIWKYNEHHFTTSFLYKTLLPNIANLMGFEIPYHKLVWQNKLIKFDDFDIDVSRYISTDEQTQFNVYDLTYNIGVWGEFNVALNWNDVTDKYHRDSIYEYEFCGKEMVTDFHKIYIYPHTCSKILNTGESNGKRLLISCDSQMIPIIPILGMIYKEVIILDNRNGGFSPYSYIKDMDFDDILLVFGYTGSRNKILYDNLIGL